MLEALRSLEVETHLVMSRWARVTLAHETNYSLEAVEKLATVVHHGDNQAACILHGSYKTGRHDRCALQHEDPCVHTPRI